MSFQAYLDNIRAKTGKTPTQLKLLAAEAGVLKSEMKASELLAWLKKEYDAHFGDVSERQRAAYVQVWP